MLTRTSNFSNSTLKQIVLFVSNRFYQCQIGLMSQNKGTNSKPSQLL